jgi:hypothetical protein
MRRALSLFAVLVAALGLSVVPAGSASALGGESLLCRIVPVSGNPPFTPTCSNRKLITGTYSDVFNTSGTYDSITWSLPAGYPPNPGCGGFDCSINMSSSHDQDAVVSVVLTQGGASVTLTAHAHINAVCGTVLC